MEVDVPNMCFFFHVYMCHIKPVYSNEWAGNKHENVKKGTCTIFLGYLSFVIQYTTMHHIAKV